MWRRRRLRQARVTLRRTLTRRHHVQVSRFANTPRSSIVVVALVGRHEEAASAGPRGQLEPAAYPDSPPQSLDPMFDCVLASVKTQTNIVVVEAQTHKSQDLPIDRAGSEWAIDAARVL